MGNQIKRMRVLALVAFLSLTGCAAHNPQASKDAAANVPAEKSANADQIIFLTKGLPQDVEYDIVGDVAANRAWYGGMDKVFKKMSTDARALKADAIIYVNTWYSPAGASWFAPHAHGTAVKIRNRDAVDLNKLDGDWH